MNFDIFHSIGRIDTVKPRRSDADTFRDFFAEAKLAEDLGFETVWAAESHFSSEVQKKNPNPVIPAYQGEVGLNNDSMILAESLFARTSKIGFGTAIMNIVGGNGGPIAAADRVRALAWHNHLRDEPRKLHIGIATGRFPYINRPFGIVPRDASEVANWSAYTRYIFLEALEIFLRLQNGEVLGSRDLTRHVIPTEKGVGDGIPYRPRWDFEPLKLVPELEKSEWAKHLNFVLGSHDPLARDVALKFGDLDVFNLSFTPPDQIDATHAELTTKYKAAGLKWGRRRMPRTVLVFIDESAAKAKEMASRCFDTYIEAMRGTAKFPPKDELIARALVGDPVQIREQLDPANPRRFHADDRLMLWFEFNQSDSNDIKRQMRLFAERVVPHLPN